MGRNSKTRSEHVRTVSSDLGSCSVRTQNLDQKIWTTLPEDVVLSILAKLSWDEITGLSHTWMKLFRALMDQHFLEEYAAGRLQKPICVLEGNLSRDLMYTMVAGDGLNKFHTLVLSKQKGLKTLSDYIRDTYNLPMTSDDSGFEFHSAGCFVFVEFVDYRPRSPRDKNFLIVMNPTNGTASQIYLPDRDISYHQFYVNGIFKAGDLEYHILGHLYERNQDGDLFYMRSLPKEERLGPLSDDAIELPERSLAYGIFYLYRSSTKSWTNLVGGNVFANSEFRDPVLYKGTVHALLVADAWMHCVSVSTLYQVCYVEEISGRTKWTQLAVPLPNPTLCFAHLFMFRGMLMLVAGVPISTGSRCGVSMRSLSSVCIWRLHEESRNWIEFGCMPDAFVRAVEFPTSYRDSAFQTCYASGDYMMLIANAYKVREYTIMVMFNIATSNWQLIQREGPRGQYNANQARALFEPRLDTHA